MSLGRLKTEADLKRFVERYQRPAPAYVLQGAGSPEGAVVAPVGTLYLRSDGGAGTTLYVKESGDDENGWVAK